MKALAAKPHSTADEVAGQVRETLGSVSTQAVYDVLRACVSAGLVRRIEPAGSSARYETRIGDNHHHLVCRVCGRVTDVDCVVGDAPACTRLMPAASRSMRQKSFFGVHAMSVARKSAGGPAHDGRPLTVEEMR